MMRRVLWITIGLVAVLVTAIGLPSDRAAAGPASYDKASKSFRFRYTFANLPAGVQDASGVQNIPGATSIKASPDQEATVRGLVRLVSDVLYQITEGRAKIGSADYVDDIKDADLVISMVGNPNSPGWSTLKGSDGKPGQMVLYYQSLAATTQQDVVFSAVHEMCHYLFGLADEYNYGNFPNGCPPKPGPGCLMDNYRPGMRGFMGKLCEGDHNAQSTQPKSCKALVDDYFSSHGVTEGDKDPNVTPFVPDARPTVVAAAINQTRAEAAKKVQSRRSGSLGSSVGAGLRSFAGRALKDLVDEFNRNNTNKLIFTSQQLRVAADLISKAGAVLPLDRPAGLSVQNFAKLKAEAERLGNSPEIETKKSDSARFSTIRTQLRSYLRVLLKTDGGASGVDATEQTALVERLAREQSRSADQKKLDRLVSLGNIQSELSLVTAENIIRVLDEMDAPGIPRQLEILGDFRKRFKELSIPGRTSAGFGLRRTRFVTPDPIDPAYDIVLTQGGVVPYKSIRDRGFFDFSRLIDRARIELVRPSFSAAIEAVNPRIDRPFEAIPEAQLQAAREINNRNLDAFINEILNQLQRNRLENIGVLVPPGGLPPELGGMLQVFQTKLREDFDVRLDVAMVGAGKIADELRHFSVASHGAVLTVTDLDEVGAIAQRLKNEQTSGSWVNVPQPSTLPQRNESRPPTDGTALEAFKTKLNKDPIKALLTGYDLQVVAWGGAGVPTSGTNLVVVGTDNNGLLHVRVFDASGSQVADTDESQSGTTQPGAIPALKQRLPGLLPPRDLTIAEKAKLVGEVTSIFGQTLHSSPGGQLLGAESVDAKLKTFSEKGAIPEPIRQKVDAARSAISLLNQAMGDLGTLALDPGTAKYRGQDLHARLGEVAKTNPASALVNLQLTRTIYSAKVQVDTLKRAIAEVKQAQGSAPGDLAEAVTQAEKAFGTELSAVDVLLRRFERLLEGAVEVSGATVPIYQRVDRVVLDKTRIALESGDIGSAAARPNGARINAQDRVHSPIDLARFYAEKIVNRQEDADLELVVGLSRPLPKVWDPGQHKAVAAPRPKLELYRQAGLARTLEAEPGKSSETLFVYRVPSAFPLEEGWYDPLLNIDQRVMRRLAGVKLKKDGQLVTEEKEIDEAVERGEAEPNTNPRDWDDINFTFSVGSTRRNVQLITGLVQPLGTPTRGTLSRAEGYATLQVQVSAGSSVLDARVRGFYQMITKGPDPIVLKFVSFADNGQDGDAQANDGIYTGKIDIHEVNEETEFRVFVLADTTDGKARYIPLDNPNRDDLVPDPVDLAALPSDRRPKDKEAAAREQFDQRKLRAEKDTKAAEGTAIKFQRATSIHFRVKP